MNEWCPDALIDALETMIRLKEVRRTGWVLRGVTDAESVADHAWGTAQLCLALAPEDVNVARAVMIALVHDLAEVVTGDIPRRAAPGAQHPSPETKEAMERRALHAMAGEERDGFFPRGRLRQIRHLWEEYAAGTSREAQFVRDMNLIDMCLQAVIYEGDRRYDPAAGREHFPDYEALDEFFETCRDRFSTDTGRKLYQALLLRYRRIRDNRDGVPQG